MTPEEMQEKIDSLREENSILDVALQDAINNRNELAAQYNKLLIENAWLADKCEFFSIVMNAPFAGIKWREVAKQAIKND